jgi:hypothetical protein
MGATDEFVKIAVQDILGKQGPSPEVLQEAARRDSPAMAEFVNIATKDLMGGEELNPKTKDVDPAKILENAEELRNAFAGSATAPIKSETAEAKEILIDEFKEKAGKEAEDTLQKLLKGLK